MTCAEIEALLAAGGRAAIEASAEAQAHVGECEACADKLIELEEAIVAAPPATPAWPETEVALPSSSPVDAAVTPADSTPEPAASGPPPLAPPPRAPVAVAPPLVPPKPQPMDWLPSLSSAPKAGLWQGLSRRGSLRIRPVHFWLGSLISAVLGAVVVLVIVLVATRRERPEPQMELIAVEDQPEFGDAVLPDLARLPREAVTKVKTGRPGVKQKNRNKGAADEPQPAVVIPPPGSQPLAPAEVSAGIKANLGKLGPCFTAARKRRETIPGKHTLVFDFVILPSGAVKEGALTGPEYLVRTRLGSCLTAKVKTWRFSASGAGTPVRNLQLPITMK